MCLQCVTTEPSACAEEGSDWTLNQMLHRAIRFLQEPLVMEIMANVVTLINRLRAVQVPTCQLSLLSIGNSRQHPSRANRLQCRAEMAAHLLPLLPLFLAPTEADSVCVLVAKHHHHLLNRHPILHLLRLQLAVRIKSAKAKADSCSLREWQGHHLKLPQVVLERVAVIRLCHPKKPNSRTGNGERTTIRWKRPPRVRRKKQLDEQLPARWLWAKVWLAPSPQAVPLHRRVPVLRPELLFVPLRLPALTTFHHAQSWIQAISVWITTTTVAGHQITNKCPYTLRVYFTGTEII